MASKTSHTAAAWGIRINNPFTVVASNFPAPAAIVIPPANCLVAVAALAADTAFFSLAAVLASFTAESFIVAAVEAAVLVLSASICSL